MESVVSKKIQNQKQKGQLAQQVLRLGFVNNFVAMGGYIRDAIMAKRQFEDLDLLYVPPIGTQEYEKSVRNIVEIFKIFKWKVFEKKNTNKMYGIFQLQTYLIENLEGEKLDVDFVYHPQHMSNIDFDVNGILLLKTGMTTRSPYLDFLAIQEHISKKEFEIMWDLLRNNMNNKLLIHLMHRLNKMQNKGWKCLNFDTHGLKLLSHIDKFWKNYTPGRKAKDKDDICRICLDKIKLNMPLSNLACHHQYHHLCMVIYFLGTARQESQMLCPTCKQQI